MIYNFHEWMAVRKEAELLNETLPRDERPNPFLHLQQKEGDFVYFGVHDLSRFYQEKGYIPPELDINMVAQKMGRIADANYVDHAVTVIANQDPYHFGYRKLESPRDRQKRREKAGNIEVKIPVHSLEDITQWLGSGAVMSGNKVWLVIDGNTKHQQSLMREIRKKEHERTQGIDQASQRVAPTTTVDPNEVQKVKQAWQADAQQVRDQKPTAASLFGEPQQAPTAYQMQGRNVIPTDPKQMSLLARIRNNKQGTAAGTPQLDVAHTDYNRYWKRHNDTQVYEYFE